MSYLQKKKLAFMSVVNKVKGFVRSVVGIPPLTLPDAVGEDLLDYKVYGNSEQNGTPTPEAPVDIESVGEKTDDGRYKIPIKVIGKNLLNEEKLVKDFDANAAGEKYKVTYETVEGIKGFKLYGSTGYKVTQYMPFEANQQYTISFKYYDVNNNNKTGSSVFIFYTDGSRGEVLIGSNDRLEDKTWKELSFTSAANKTVSYIYFSYSNGASYTYFADFQVEKGTIATAYEPYKDLGTTNIYLNEPLRKAGNYADYVDFKNSKVVRVIKEINLSPKIIPPAINGMNEGGWYHYASYGNYYYIFKPDEYYAYNNDIAFKCNSLSFKALSNSSAITIADGEYQVFYRDTGSSIYRITINEATYNKLLEVDECYFYYPLAEPTEEVIDLPQIPTAKGTTTLIADTTTQPSNMDVTYYSSI